MKQIEPIVIHTNDCPLEQWDDPRRGAVKWHTIISADRTASRSLTVGIAELPPSDTASLALHRHPPEEVYHVLSGTGIVTIAETQYPIRPGSTVFIPGNTLHSVHTTGTETLRLLYVFATDSFDRIDYDFAAPDAAAKTTHP